MRSRSVKKLLSIGHSYVVGVNRQFPNEMARVGGDEWDVTAVAPTLFRRVRTTPRPRLFGSKTENYQLKTVPMHFTDHIHVAVYGPELRRILSGDWDVIHSWEEPYIVSGGQVALWRPARALLVYSTFQNLLKQYPPPFNLIEHYSLSRAAGWIAFGRSVEETLVNRKVYANREHRMIPIGVDVERFQPDENARSEIRQQLGWTESFPPVVGYLGRLVEEKGLDLLMATLDRVEAPWRALIIGGGPLEGRLREWESQSKRQVRIVTGVGHKDVPRYLNAMDILCAPSKTTRRWREQFGRMLIEAFACGVPIVASDSGEIPNVVGDAGVIVGENDEAGWVDSLNTLLRSDGKRRELSERGLQRARNVFSWSTVARQNLRFFDELLEK